MTEESLLTASIAIVIAAGLFGMNRAVSGIESGLVFNANVEALARGEGGGKAICYSEIAFLRGIPVFSVGLVILLKGMGLKKGDIVSGNVV